MKTKSLLTTLTVLAIGATAYAAPITFTFQENGSNLSLGSSSTFVSGGASLTAYANSGQALYAKYTASDATETGLGITSDSDHEIFNGAFVQLYSGGALTLDSLFLTSVQSGETATIYFSTVLGTLGTLQSTITANQTLSLASFGAGYIGISAGAGNILVSTVTGHTNVPDAGSTALLLGSVLSGLALLKRKLVA